MVDLLYRRMSDPIGRARRALRALLNAVSGRGGEWLRRRHSSPPDVLLAARRWQSAHQELCSWRDMPPPESLNLAHLAQSSLEAAVRRFGEDVPDLAEARRKGVASEGRR